MWPKVAAGLTALALSLSLGAAAAPPVSPPLLRAADSRLRPTPDAPVARVAAAVADLGYDMRTIMPAGNWVASPLSVAYAYAMVRAGAGGRTAAALDELFGMPGDDLHTAFNALSSATADQHVMIGNGLFLQEGFDVGRPFLRTLATHYGAGVFPVDFSTPESADVVNKWVREQTADRMPGILRWEPGLAVVLANAIYLNADWARPFGGATPTMPMPFHTADGPVPVPMMGQAGEMPYAEGDGWQAVDLAYRNSDLVMRILLPAAGREPVDLVRGAALRAETRPRAVDLRLPKWESRTRVDLRRLGPTELYSGADLSGIGTGLRISQATHEAWIKVDEEGTEAAAATGMAVVVSAVVPPETKLHADRPFAFAILHKPTNVPLFVGRISDPSRTPG
jgi:serpin B